MNDQLKDDLTVRDLRRGGARTADSLMINSGTFSETAREGQFVAFFPKSDWRPLTASELGSLTAGKSSLADSVSIVQFAEPLVVQARRRLLPHLAAWNEANEGALAGTVREVRDEFLVDLRRQCAIVARRLGPADCALNRPGQRSTAFNFATSDYMGLHIDNHEKHGLWERDRSLLLCCVNLGSAPRFFHFINLRVRRLLEAVGEEPPPELTPEALKNRFLVMFPAYPVVRVILSPGEAYICNAQDMIHDGATNEVGAPDIAWLVSGDYAFED